MSEIEVLTEFKNGIISFLDELIDQFPAEGDLVIMRIFLKDQIPIKDIMDQFMFKLNTDDKKLRKMVKDRNEVFFLNDPFVFSSDKSKASHFKKLWRSGQLDKDDKEVVWCWVDSFVHIGEKYLKAVTLTS
jgi:hypothetical protein